MYGRHKNIQIKHLKAKSLFFDLWFYDWIVLFMRIFSFQDKIHMIHYEDNNSRFALKCLVEMDFFFFGSLSSECCSYFTIALIWAKGK